MLNSLTTSLQRKRLPSLGLFALTPLLLAGCVQMPSGPSVAVMPAQNKPFEVFMQEDQLCRSWAAHSIGQPGNEAAADTMLRSTVAGATLGAVAGVLLGGDHNSAGAGAAIGTMIGASSGANQSATSAWTAQRQYDIAYAQCMYSKGNFVPSYGYRDYRYSTPMPPMPPQPQPPMQR